MPEWSSYLKQKVTKSHCSRIGWIGLDFMDSCLRGAGQVVFCNNPISGLFILLALFLSGWFLAISGILSLVSVTLFAKLIGGSEEVVRSGLFGYNGLLIGLAFTVFFVEDREVMVGFLIFLPLFSIFVLLATANFLSERFGVAAFTFPFNIIIILFRIRFLFFN